MTRDDYDLNEATAAEAANLEWFSSEKGEAKRAKAEIDKTMWEDVKLIKIGKKAVVKLHQLHFAMCYRVLGSASAAPYAAGTDMLVRQMQQFIDDEAGGGCSADGCTADQFEWATDQAPASSRRCTPTRARRAAGRTDVDEHSQNDVTM